MLSQKSFQKRDTGASCSHGYLFEEWRERLAPITLNYSLQSIIFKEQIEQKSEEQKWKRAISQPWKNVNLNLLLIIF